MNQDIKPRTAPQPAPQAKKIDGTMAIAGLLLNILVLPGLGSMIAGKKQEGTWQLVLFLVGLPLTIVIVGFALIAAAWIWALVTGITLVQESGRG